eukprot:CAMPEP_0177426978 /NCGR_PEP_ID=MMETSP0368-20130122/73812_1 /TAXON_ID=447022 ORGANISM="Scrippsiella hangoei-like, Strain SHHI-4" /NCGR_SAMPLE_ID=MMETSP0368 /ASSEMBLY_ACC=CAM_ASM_000363 /LENGTH=33 /DNA_ID= /DNA_START= /DNA_END= /DNA_ORIENTATION=
MALPQVDGPAQPQQKYMRQLHGWPGASRRSESL